MDHVYHARSVIILPALPTSVLSRPRGCVGCCSHHDQRTTYSTIFRSKGRENCLCSMSTVPAPTNMSAYHVCTKSNRSVFLRSIDYPEISTQYTAHTTNTTVARFSPSGFYVASGDVSGTVRVWDCKGEGATKGEYHIIAGRINDIAWDGDSQRIIAVGDGKERFGHCITADSGNTVGEISGHSSQVNCVSIRQQRPLRAATGSDDTNIVFYHGAPFKFNTSLQGKHLSLIHI